MSRRDHGQTDGDGQTVIFLTPTHPHQSLVEYCNPFHTKTYSEHTASQPSPFPLATHYHKSPFGLSPGIPPSLLVMACHCRIADQQPSILRFTGMIAYVTKTFKELPENTQVQTGDKEEGKRTGTWLEGFKHLVASLELTSHNVTSLLAILSVPTSSRTVPHRRDAHDA